MPAVPTVATRTGTPASRGTSTSSREGDAVSLHDPRQGPDRARERRRSWLVADAVPITVAPQGLGGAVLRVHRAVHGNRRLALAVVRERAQQHRKEEQQHHFGRELGLADGRDKAERAPTTSSMTGGATWSAGPGRCPDVRPPPGRRRVRDRAWRLPLSGTGCSAAARDRRRCSSVPVPVVGAADSAHHRGLWLRTQQSLDGAGSSMALYPSATSVRGRTRSKTLPGLMRPLKTRSMRSGR